MNILGVDTGGTFTDFVLLQDGHLRVHKVLSTPDAPERAILDGIRDLQLDSSKQTLYVIHGSTVATNAVLENKGVPTVFITNRGLADMLTIGRQARKQLYNLQPEPQTPPVPKSYCLETGGRLSADASIVEPLSEVDITILLEQIEQLKPAAVAINLLFSFLDDNFECRIAAAIPHSIYVSRSSQILPECKEYERGIATWLNASVGPLMSTYLNNLCNELQRQYTGVSSVSIMQSSAATVSAETAALRAVNMLLSGPAGGLVGAQYVAQVAGKQRLLTFDIGGTSTDVALVDGDLNLTTEGHIGGYPVAVPMVDMHTIGAGGGSIASIDVGGLLKVGPASAGASPGPACYGLGGREATVSDANLILGRLQGDSFLGGQLTLDLDAAKAAMQPLAEALQISLQEAALGVIRVMDENMLGALKVMSVQRGIDPKELCLLAFGGAGGLHVCALASALNMRQALVPKYAGVLSALGMLVAPRGRNVSKSFLASLQTLDITDLERCLDQLAVAAEAELVAEGIGIDDIQRQDLVDIRYQGQSFNLTLVWRGRETTAVEFHNLHEQRYGHRLELPLQLVTARIRLSSATRILDLSRAPTDSVLPTESLTSIQPKYRPLYGHVKPVAVYQRDQLKLKQCVSGPALICDTVATTYVTDDWDFYVDEVGNLVLSRRKA